MVPARRHPRHGRLPPPARGRARRRATRPGHRAPGRVRAGSGWMVGPRDLLVSDFNDGAQRFYARHGYVQVGRLPALVASNVDELLFWRRLPRSSRGGGRRAGWLTSRLAWSRVRRRPPMRVPANRVLCTVGTPCTVSAVGSTETHRALVSRSDHAIALRRLRRRAGRGRPRAQHGGRAPLRVRRRRARGYSRSSWPRSSPPGVIGCAPARASAAPPERLAPDTAATSPPRCRTTSSRRPAPPGRPHLWRDPPVAAGRPVRPVRRRPPPPAQPPGADVPLRRPGRAGRPARPSGRAPARAERLPGRGRVRLQRARQLRPHDPGHAAAPRDRARQAQRQAGATAWPRRSRRTGRRCCRRSCRPRST